ncbi:putative ammonium transporter 3 [Penaeus japonicus]|uniref:putative ammonium transporter 3 n=1 Tax=Penaeus japonicus TaxID=27405 RepID=UPI001C7146C9|nr:putative ammonium transporter 3 [Penaeus japonicus]
MGENGSDDVTPSPNTEVSTKTEILTRTLSEIFSIPRDTSSAPEDSTQASLAKEMLNLAQTVMGLNASGGQTAAALEVTDVLNASVLEAAVLPLNLTDAFNISDLGPPPNITVPTSRGGGVAQDNFGDDAAWILTATFIIFTMQSGFGLLESGAVSMKNEANIMVKNVVDVVLGGITYWLFGYALSFGESEWTNPFCGWGGFALNPSEDEMGKIYTTFFFQLSFATTATTIVSGAVAERFNFVAYVIFSAVNTVVYCLPAGWLWGSHGFLYKLGVVDIAGSCGVHLCGGSSALIASKLVGPRIGRYDDGEDPLPMGSPTNAILGMFMLWWGWLGFNCGSTFGISENKWKYAARTAVTTLQASIGGGLAGMSLSWYKNHRLEIGDVVNSVLGALVSITAGCALFTTWEALFIGIVGGLISVLAMPLFDKLHIDDPVGATSVHGLCGIWAMVSIGLFVEADSLLGMTGGKAGLFRGGGFYLLGVQTLACVVTSIWAMSVTFCLLMFIDKFVVSIRMSEWEELVGADFAEHGIRRRGVGVSRAVSVLGLQHNGFDYSDIAPQGDNPCHQMVLNNLENLRSRRASTVSKAVLQVTKQKNGKLPELVINNHDLKNGNTRNSDITPIELPDSFAAWP